MGGAAAEMGEDPWFLLFGGTSVDGLGQGVYESRTTDIHEAAQHLVTCQSPYSTGNVTIVTSKSMRVLR